MSRTSLRTITRVPAQIENGRIPSGLEEKSRGRVMHEMQFWDDRHERVPHLGLKSGNIAGATKSGRRKTTHFRTLAILSLLLGSVHHWNSFAYALSYAPTGLDATDPTPAVTDTFNWSVLPPSKAPNWTDCYSGFQCARLSVPLLHSEPTSGEAAVALIKFPSKYSAGDEKYRGPILLNPGGPGVSGVSFLLDQVETFQSILSDEFDLIGLWLHDSGYQHLQGPDRSWQFFLLFPKSLLASESSLGEAVAWSNILSNIVADRISFIAERVSTPLVARDMLTITEALGQDKLQYWGVSYGSVLGATFAAMFPSKVGRLIIDGVDDAENYYEGLWSNNLIDTDAALMDIYQQCANAGPSLCPIYEKDASSIKTRVDRLLSKLKSQPIAFYNATGAEGTYDVVDYGLVRQVIFGTLYTTHASGANLTKAIAALERGDPSQIYELSDRGSFNQQFQCNCSASGSPAAPSEQRGFDVTAAIACGDVVRNRAEDFEAVREAYDEMARTSSFADNWPFRAWCSAWEVRGIERFNGSFVQSTSYPLLLIGNTADPVTPLRNAHKMSKGFKDSVVLTQNSSGHFSLSATSSCTHKAVRAYFVNGTLPEEGTVCQVESSIFGDN